MTPVEMCHLAAFLASKYPSARVQESSPQFWHALLAEVDDTDALIAFIRLVCRQSDVPLADICAEAHRMQAERLARYPESDTDLNQTRHYRTEFPAVLTMQAARHDRATTHSGNPHEAVARARKAARLYAVVRQTIDASSEFPLSPADIHLISSADSVAPARRAIEQRAGVRPASPITWAMVEQLLIEHYFGPDAR